MVQAVEENPKLKPDTGAIQLTIERVKFLTEQLRDALPNVQELQQAAKQLDQEITDEMMQLALSMKLKKNIDRDAVEAFKKRPFTFTPVPGREGWFYLLMPRFVDMQIGWLDSQDLSYNHFIVNRYMDWLGELPELIKKELGFKPPPELEYAGGVITGDSSALDAFARKNPELIKSRRGNKLFVRPKRHFEVLAGLIKEGCLPFTRQPISHEILTERRCDIELRPYQKEAWKTLCEWSHMGLFYPASVGKSYFGVWLAAHIKPPTLVVVPTILLKETWEERITLHTDMRLGEEVEVLTYQSAIKRYGDQRKQFNLKLYDEVHHLPANELSRLATIPSLVSVGFTASPAREDKREEYIYALTGRPQGLNWDFFRKLNLIRNPVCNVWIVKSTEAKIKQVGELAEGKKTLVFCDSIELGTILSKRYDVPHVYGATKKDRLKTIQDAELVVVSRVGDEGISLPEVEQVIEISWLGRSRRQELQRFTRLLHSRVGQRRRIDVTGLSEEEQRRLEEQDDEDAEEERRLREPAYHILMTLEEYARDRKRLFSIMDKGFKVEIHREGISERTMRTVSEPTARRPSIIRQATGAGVARTEPGRYAIPGLRVEIPPALQARLPYIDKTIAKLPTKLYQQVAVAILANPQNQYSIGDLGVATSNEPLNIQTHAPMKLLIQRKLVKKAEHGKYQSAL